MAYNHTHHGRREEEEEYPPPARPPPPPFYGGNEPPPPSYGRNEPPPPFYGGNEPPPPFYGGNEPPPPFYGRNDPPPPFPPPPQVSHTSHTGPGPDSYGSGNSYHPPPPPSAVDNNPHHHSHTPHFPTHHTHHSDDEITNKPTFRVYSKAETNYSLSIRDGKVILARSNPSDPHQQWIKDQKLSTRVKDEEGYPSFALINKATGQAMKHSVGATHPVQLIPYNPKVVDESILWTESKDLGDGYRTIRMVNNIRLNVDALNGDKNHGGVHDGTTIVLWEWKKGDNQRWKIIPY
ncbi:hypothetical protein RD792_001010 [Penstemon davidsonii]|uniref:Uncharacterized protein n=1 Tax=Penstemon davidsonii TaxID=160366 RepID=A0ABR0DM97_9LAMI|nr:hypothetical protein RD792_001010 [Penstemon davidsonii]